MTFVRNPRYWGPHTAYLDRIVMRFCRSCALLPTPPRCSPVFRQGDVDMARTRDPAIVSELRTHSGGEGHRQAALNGARLPLTSAWAPAGIRRSRTSSFAARSPTASTGRRLRARSSASSTRATRRATAPSFCNTQSLLPPQLGACTAIGRLLPAASSSRRDAGAEPTASTCAAGERLSLRFIGLSGADVSRAYPRAHPAATFGRSVST